MALQAVVEKIEDVEEAFRGEYKEVTDPKTKAKTFVIDIADPSKLPDVDRLNVALRKERDDHKGTKAKLAPFATLGEPADVQAKLDRIPELEAAAEGKLDDKKIETIVESRIKAKVAPIERERDQLKVQVGEKDKLIGDMTVAETRRKVSGSLGKAAREAKVVAEALDDIELYGDRLFEVNESGDVVTRDNVGVTPGLGPKEWLSDMQAKRPHWWGPTFGGGAGGNRGGGGGADGENPWTAEHWNMTKQGAIVRSDRKKADTLAVRAGTTVGGKKPELKK